MHRRFRPIRTCMATRRTIKENWCDRRIRRWFTPGSVLTPQVQAITKFRNLKRWRASSGNLRQSRRQRSRRYKEKSKAKAQVLAAIKGYRLNKKLQLNLVVFLFPVYKGLSRPRLNSPSATTRRLLPQLQFRTSSTAIAKMKACLVPVPMVWHVAASK